MNIEIYIQARMSSTRLPGKVLKQVLGKPLLFYVIERLKSVHSHAIVVLTTTNKEDDAIVSFCKQNQIPCYQGPSENVLERYYLAAQERQPDTIIRITSDCPLIDPEIVNDLIELYTSSSPKIDYASNCLERTFPRGLDCEIFSFSALEQTYKNAKTPSEKEHVTPYIYNHADKFSLKNLSCTPNLSHYRWTVDTPEDFKLIQLILEALYPINPKFRMQDVLELMQQHPEWIKINEHIEQKAL